jgi:hypothetical protein
VGGWGGECVYQALQVWGGVRVSVSVRVRVRVLRLSGTSKQAQPDWHWQPLHPIWPSATPGWQAGAVACRQKLGLVKRDSKT